MQQGAPTPLASVCYLSRRSHIASRQTNATNAPIPSAAKMRPAGQAITSGVSAVGAIAWARSLPLSHNPESTFLSAEQRI